MLSTLWLARTEPVPLWCDYAVLVRYSELRAPQLPQPTAARSNAPNHIKRQAPETSSHHSVRPISGAYHQLLNFFTLRFFILRAWS